MTQPVDSAPPSPLDPDRPTSSARSLRGRTAPLATTPLVITRRAVLVGGASAFLLAACSSGSSDDDAEVDVPPPLASLLALFPLNLYITAGVPQRIAFGVSDPEGGMTSEGPDQLDFTITAPDGTVTEQTSTGHRQGLPYTYYPLYFTPAEGGNHTIATVVDGAEVESVFTIGDKGSSDVPGPTDPLPRMATPTTTDSLGVDPICTQDPPCPLHAVSLETAMDEAKPIVYLVATPKFCQTGICGPVMDILQATVADYADRVTFIHQEVYKSEDEAVEKGSTAELAEQVAALNILAEPVLFIADADGVIRHRLDTTYDDAELRAAIDDVLA